MTPRTRQVLEIGAPGAAVGVLAGSVVGALAALVGQPIGWAMVSALTLGLPLGLLGGGYGVLVATGLFKAGVFTPAALYWMVGFPVSRLVHETVTPALLGGNFTPPSDVLTFLAFQALVSMGFAIGFVWMFERTTPPWLVRIKDHNPAAERLYEQYSVHAATVWEARERKRARRAVRLGTRPETAPAGAAARAKARRSS